MSKVRYGFIWLNDDRDVVVNSVVLGNSEQDADPASGQPDFQHTTIANARDLEDFPRVHIKAPMDFNPSDTAFEVKLQFVDVTDGSPGINLWKALTPGATYLTSETVAGNLVGTTKLTSVTSSSEQTIPNDLFDNSDKKAALLFDARTKGKGALRVRIYKSGQQIAEDKVYMDLKPIHEMYEHWTVGDTATMNVGDIPATATQIGTAYTATSPEEKNYILYVNGWRMQPWERRAFAETAYKRLYWQGYKGRFGLFSWPTEFQNLGVNTLIDGVERRNYDRSERKAWVSAQGLRGVLQTLDGQYPGKVRVFAHSMGNVVASEALRLESHSASPQAIIRTYVATQAATVAHAYDPTRLTILNPPQAKTPNAYSNYPPTPGMEYFRGTGVAAVNQFVNFFNPEDYALHSGPLGAWEFNQAHKPDTGAGYHFQNNQFVRNIPPPGVVLTFPLNTYEIFAHADQARSRALGVQNAVGAPFDPAKQINLRTQLNPTDQPGTGSNFGSASAEHSAQFNYTNMRRRRYWRQLLDAFGLLPNP